MEYEIAKHRILHADIAIGSRISHVETLLSPKRRGCAYRL